jgi:hypothetical protein
VTDHSAVWSSLEQLAAQRRSAGDQRPVGRWVGSFCGLRLYLAITIADGHRQLLVELTSGRQLRPEDLPAWRGLSVTVQQLDMPGVTNRPFLVLRQELPGTERVYEALIEDLTDELGSLTTSDALRVRLIDLLRKWEAFFSAYGSEGLAPEAQRGLYGELKFLAEHLVPALGPARAIGAWTGPRRTPQDFQLGGAAIEVKTSIARQHLKISIASEQQLDDRGLESLYLAVFSLAERDVGEVTRWLRCSTGMRCA